MTYHDIAEELGVELPKAYAEFWERISSTAYSGTCEVDFWHDPAAIIRMTKSFRAGAGSNPPWPNNLVFIGDDGAACPFALDVEAGMILHLDHGNTDREYVRKPAPLAEWLDQLVRDMKEIEAERTEPLTALDIALSVAIVVAIAGAIGYALWRLTG